jgi:hypothetical protein
MRFILPLLLACGQPTDTGEVDDAVCARDCLDSPYHRCGAYVAGEESMSCTALAVGVAVDDWSAYLLTVDGVPVPSLREDGTLTADCDGSALLQVWSVDEEESGCAMVEAIPQTCGAVEAGLAFDPDMTGWVVEAITAEGEAAIIGAYTTSNRLYATCPKGAEMARVIGVLPDLADAGLGEDYW